MIANRPFTVLCLCSSVLAIPTKGQAQAPVASPSPAPVAMDQPAESPVRAVRGHNTTMPGVADLFKPLADDFRRMGGKSSLAMLQIGAAGALTFSPWDRRIQEAEWGNGTLHAALKPGAVVGGFIFQSTAAAATYAVGRATGHTRIATLGADLVRAQIVSQTTTQAVKLTTQRTRPDGTSLSFPSGHTSSSFATASVLHAHFGAKVGVPAYAMAAWVAASRVQMKRHHVSDVIVGASVGLLAGRAVTFGHGSGRFALSPMAVPGGAGVSLVRVGGRSN